MKKIKISAHLECAGDDDLPINLIIEAERITPEVITEAIKAEWLAAVRLRESEPDAIDSSHYEMVAFVQTMCGYAFILKSEDLAALYYAGLAEVITDRG